MSKEGSFTPLIIVMVFSLLIILDQPMSLKGAVILRGSSEALAAERTLVRSAEGGHFKTL